MTLSSLNNEVDDLGAFQLPVKTFQAALSIVICLISASIPFSDKWFEFHRREHGAVLAAWTLDYCWRFWEVLRPKVFQCPSQLPSSCFAPFLHCVCLHLSHAVRGRMAVAVQLRTSSLLSEIISCLLLSIHASSELVASAVCSAISDVASLVQESIYLMHTFAEQLLPGLRGISDNPLFGGGRQIQVITISLFQRN